MLRVGIVAGEASGDLLAAGLIAAIKKRHPDAQFEGIAGPHMIEAGCRMLHPTEKLSVMGLFEVLERLPELLRIRKGVYRHFIDNPPDVFIGVDAPDFTIPLEGRLKQAGIRTVHYVSPTVWAWRQGRVKKIAGKMDLMLTLFPFEARFYEAHDLPVRFVGHPLADLIPIEGAAKTPALHEELGLAPGTCVIALLPGSRMSEVKRLARPFLAAARILWQHNPNTRFITPLPSAGVEHYFQAAMLAHAPDLPITIVRGRSREVMAAADAVLLASGTATLEATLLKKPMVMAYRLSHLTYWLVKALGLMKIERFAMPNLLTGEDVVEEFIQYDVTPERLAAAMMRLLEQTPEAHAAVEQRFTELHRTLRCNASEQAAEAVLSLLE